MTYKNAKSIIQITYNDIIGLSINIVQIKEIKRVIIKILAINFVFFMLLILTL